MRLADEYDAAQERGEVKRLGGDTSGVEYANTASAADLGLRRRFTPCQLKCALT